MNSSKSSKQEKITSSEDDNQSGDDDDEDVTCGRLVYNSELVHSGNNMQIMRVILEVPETYSKSAQEHIVNMLKDYRAANILNVNLSDLRNNLSNIKSVCSSTTPIIFSTPKILEVSSFVQKLRIL